MSISNAAVETTRNGNAFTQVGELKNSLLYFNSRNFLRKSWRVFC